eukprot:s740_g19.t1
MIPELTGNAQFTLEAYSDSSWADCKTTRKSTSSGVICLNGALVMSVCRTQASVALSSCEAELYAANGLMVESIYLFRLCKFLCGDESDVGSDMVQQRLFTDSSSALALVRRTGTGRLKHIQIKQFFLQSLLRTGVFSIFKINTKLNPGDLSTKRLSGERRKFLGRLINLFTPSNDEVNDDNALRRIRRINRVTREQVIRLVQMAGATIGMCMQLKGCSNYVTNEAGVGINYDGQLVWWTLLESIFSTTSGMTTMVCKVLWWIFFCMVQVAGVLTLLVALMYLCGGFLIWQHYWFLRRWALRNAGWMLGWRWTWLIKPVAWALWYLLRREIIYQHDRFREAGQEGDMMVDIEQLYGGVDEYLTGGLFDIGAAAGLQSPEREEAVEQPEAAADMEAEAVAEADPFAGQDLSRLNGQEIDRAERETENEEAHEEEHRSPTGSDDMDVDDETESQRALRYSNSTQDEVSDPDEWADRHYGRRLG